MIGRVALTFDDGPDPLWTPRVLDALRAARARATFFVISRRAGRYPEIVRRARREGHEVSFHCAEHRRHDGLSPAGIRADTREGLRTLRDLGEDPADWRVPWGFVTPATEEVAKAFGLRLAGWNADSADWRGDPAAQMLRRLEPQLRAGAVVIVHDGMGPGATREGCAETVALIEPLVLMARSRGLVPSPLGLLSGPIPDRNPDFVDKPSAFATVSPDV